MTMSFLCQACGQHPFPSLKPYREYIDRQRKVSLILDTKEFPPSQLITDNLTLYIQSLRLELEAADTALKSILQLSAPIYKLPNEILSCIFQELFTSARGRLAKSNEVQPFTLVCKRWRNIIISTPKFWTRFYFPRLARPSSRKQASLSQFFKNQLDRVGGALPLALDCSYSLTSPSLKVLRPAMDRVTYLRTYPYYRDAEKVLNSWHLLPKLESLNCTILPSPHFDSDASVSDMNWDGLTINLSSPKAPSLTNVSLRLQESVRHITLPWAQLKSLRLLLLCGCENDFDPCCLVRELEAIEELEIDLGSDCQHWPTADRLGQVTLPHLHTLSLSGYTQQDFPFQLLQQLDSPSLKELKFTLTDDHQKLIKAMSNPRLSTITKLQLNFDHSLRSTGRHFNADEVEEVLDSLWVLKCLESFSCNLNRGLYSAERVLQVLSQDHHSKGRLFPNLAELNISRAEFHEGLSSLIPFHTFVRARVSPVDVPVDARQPLKKVLVSFDCTHDPNSTDSEGWRRVRRSIGYEHRMYCDRTSSVMLTFHVI